MSAAVRANICQSIRRVVIIITESYAGSPAQRNARPSPSYVFVKKASRPPATAKYHRAGVDAPAGAERRALNIAAISAPQWSSMPVWHLLPDYVAREPAHLHQIIIIIKHIAARHLRQHTWPTNFDSSPVAEKWKHMCAKTFRQAKLNKNCQRQGRIISISRTGFAPSMACRYSRPPSLS